MDSFRGNNFDPQSLHTYAYAHEVPINRVDPSGRFAILLEILITAAIAIGVRGAWEGARTPGYVGAITLALLVVLLVTAADVLPRAYERIRERQQNGKLPYFRYDFRGGITSFEPGTWVLGTAAAAALDWSQAVSITGQYEMTTLFMYTIMARPIDVIPWKTVNGLPQYKLEGGSLEMMLS